MNIPKIMITCFLCTIIIEVLVSLILGVRDKKDIINIILVNILTNPLVVSISLFINVRYGLDARRISMIILELSALLSEGFIYFKTLNYKKINPFVLSLILNSSSYFIGEIINKFL